MVAWESLVFNSSVLIEAYKLNWKELTCGELGILQFDWLVETDADDL